MRQPKPSEPKHLTASQAAALLQVSPKTVSRWAKEGKLPFVRTLGGHRRYPDSEIRALVDSLSERPTADGDQGSAPAPPSGRQGLARRPGAGLVCPRPRDGGRLRPRPRR